VRAKGSYVRPFASALRCDRRPEGYRQSAPSTVATLATRDFLSFRVPDLRFSRTRFRDSLIPDAAGLIRAPRFLDTSLLV
jgi:hypothetical protein